MERHGTDDSVCLVSPIDLSLIGASYLEAPYLHFTVGIAALLADVRSLSSAVTSCALTGAGKRLSERCPLDGLR